MTSGLVIAPGLDSFITEFSINSIRPKHVAFLATEATVANINQIVENCGISSYKVCFIKDLFSSSETIEEFINAFRWMYHLDDVEELYVDATNCITVIEMATYVSASFLELYRDILNIKMNFRLVYVHAQYSMGSDGVYSEVPGTEELIDLEKPIDSLSFVLAVEAIRYFNDNRYSQARENFESLIKDTTGEKNLLYSAFLELTKGYEYWDRMSYQPAQQALAESLKLFSKVKVFSRNQAFIDSIEANIQALDRLIAEDKISVTIDLFHNALRREHAKRLDDSMGRLYSCLEHILAYLKTGKTHYRSVYIGLV